MIHNYPDPNLYINNTNYYYLVHKQAFMPELVVQLSEPIGGDMAYTQTK